MSQQPQPINPKASLDTNKKLIKMYVKSTLSNVAISLASDESLNLRTVDFSEAIQNVASKLLEHEPDTDLNTFINESLEPLRDTFSDDVLSERVNNVACFMVCVAQGGNTSECKQQCNIDWILPPQ
jgi:hypothetical protein